MSDCLAVRDLHATEQDAAIGVLARGMRDNPLHAAAYGDDPERRLRCHARLMRGVLRVFGGRELICTELAGRVVGVTGVAPPGTCQPMLAQRLRLLPAVAGMGPRSGSRVLVWTSAWARRDPSWPHVHLGPVAVDASLQGRGIGSAMMVEFCRRVDRDRMASYLETDKWQNVTFYQRFGFEVTGQEQVLGVPTWYMRRLAS